MGRLWDTSPIRAEVARRTALLLDSLDGEVLVVDERSPAPSTSGSDHVVSVAWLAVQPDLDAACATLAELLGDVGRLHLIEPTLGLGSTARAQEMAATVGLRRTGWRIGRDVPTAIRLAGLVLTDLERFSMPVPSPVLRPWIHGTARVRPTYPVSGERP